MKKRFIKYILSIVVLCFLYNCNNDFLERYPLDQVSNETFWNSENDIKVYNNSLYNLAKDDINVPVMMGHTGTDGIWSLDLFTDNLAPRESSNLYYQHIRAGMHIIPTSSQKYGWNANIWQFLRAVNVGLENYSRVSIPQSTLNMYIGEARLFRGWLYAEMVSKYGDVPWVEKELNVDSEELYSLRTPREDVMNKVLADLDFACDNLPNDWGDENSPGRLNRWAALLIKSRICLFEGTWRKYHGGSNYVIWLENAATAAKELMDDGPYNLYVTGDIYHDYSTIHQMDNLSGIQEIIYWRKYDASVNYVHNAPNYGIRQNWFGGATKDFIDDYLCIDGLPINLSQLYMGDEVYENLFMNRDPRLRQSILHPEDQSIYNYGDAKDAVFPRLLGTAGAWNYESTTGFHILKMYNNDYVTLNVGQVDYPAITLRLGEALLNFAESRAELGTITQNDLDLSINLLRDRVGMPHMIIDNIPIDPRYKDDGISPLLVEIRRERRIELFMEGFRYDDLRRWKQGKKLESRSYGVRWDNENRTRFDPEGNVLLGTSEIEGVPYIDVYKGTELANPVFDETKHYLWPIPLRAISQNTNLKQNPGWD
jgi:starch-binding outer membrane protein, SusD/RagB family